MIAAYRGNVRTRLEHRRDSILGFYNLTNYIARSLRGDRRIQIPAPPWMVKGSGGR
jgi:hypothetical protein